MSKYNVTYWKDDKLIHETLESEELSKIESNDIIGGKIILEG